jgi:lipopolysaccharide/colanic/teichoic acid biosynthesis glycosyltransferase
LTPTVSALVIVGVGSNAAALAQTARAAGCTIAADPVAPAVALRGDLPADAAGILLAPEGVDPETLALLALKYTTRGVPVWLDVTSLPEWRELLPLRRIGDRAGVSLSTSHRRSLPRAIDAVVAGVALIALLPLLLVVSVLVKLSSPGPVLHRALVVGQDGRPFTWYKFRTMRMMGEDEELRRQRFAEFVGGDAAAPTKIVDESRVTAIGKFLRRHSFDELPQFLSVLKGDMTVVGPRPCLVYEFELLKPWHRQRFMVRPGLTGLWQVRGRGRAYADEMAFMDICYALGRNWRSDLRVLWATAGVVMTGRGAA